MRYLLLPLTVLWSSLLGQTLTRPELADRLIVSGPMAAAVTERDARIWVQMNTNGDLERLGESSLSLSYWPAKRTEAAIFLPVTSALLEKFAGNNTGANVWLLLSARAGDSNGPQEAIPLTFTLRNLRPGTEYHYTISRLGESTLLNDLGAPPSEPTWQPVSDTFRFATPPDWQFRADPPAFKLVTGSCLFINDPTYDRPGRPYGGELKILDHMADENPDVVLWLGDNIYQRPADWTSETGIYYRYNHVRQTPELQPLLQVGSHIAIWDDHDYGPNNADRSYPLKKVAAQAFKAYWPSPYYDQFHDGGGVTSTYVYGDVQFFLLDNRYYRSPNNRKTGEKTVLGKAQIQWLIDQLKYSQAAFKLVAIGGQVLNDYERYETYQNLAPQERQALLDTLVAEGIEGVVFLDGDRHHTILSKYQPEGFYPLYDFTISPLSSGANDPIGQPNSFYVEGTGYGDRNYATFEFSGKYGDRTLKVTVKNANGEEVWTRSIHQNDLRLPNSDR